MSTLPRPPLRDERSARMPDAVARPTNVLIVGVGGQGVLMISRVLAEVCARRGLEVKQSEVHGMAQRGGAVFSHVRFGERVWSPTIPRGEADVLVALEWAEGLRWLPYLCPERGTFLADTRRIVPPFACRDRRPGARTSYPDHGAEALRGRAARSIALDAQGVADELGNPRAANTLLLGVLSTVLDFPAEEWRSVIDASVPPRTIEVNRAAFEHGRNWSQNVEEPGRAAAVPLPRSEAQEAAEATRTPATGAGARLEIIAAWCKGCDICVQVCPERCLALDARRVVVIVDPQACSGCRVCEWLCPDFAIRVRTGSVSAQAAF